MAPLPAGSPCDRAASNPFMQPDSSAPLAVTDPDGTIIVRPAPAGATVERLLYIPAAPQEGESVSLAPLLLASMYGFIPSLPDTNHS